jgi:NAD/NADP transhydrogenase beta subunit
MTKLRIVQEIFAFMKENKKWWILPIVVMLMLLGLLIVLSQGSAVAPFIYTLF